MIRTRKAIAGVLMAVASWASPVLAVDAPWPDFRGPTRNGVAPADAKPPVKWSDTEHVKWKTSMPGEGHSSPIVFGDQVWLTYALEGGRSLHAICLNTQSGKVVFDEQVFAVPNPQPKHNTNSYASPSPVIEDGRVYIYFGVPGLACLDTKTGKPIWTKTDLRPNYLTGAGSSPILYRDLLILDCDGTDQRFIVGIDKKTGNEVWKTPRSAKENTLTNKNRAFCTPVIAEIDGKDQLLSIGAGRAYGYDPLTGRELWNVDHAGYSNVSRPVYFDGMVIFSSCYDAAELFAVKVAGAAAQGEAKPKHLEGADILWKTRQGAPYKPTPLVVNGKLYVVNDGGVVRCVDPKTGQSVWSQRMGRAYSASPLLAGGKIYLLSEKGQVHVLEPGDKPQVVAEFQLEEGFMASPAVAGNALILRSATKVYRVE